MEKKIRYGNLFVFYGKLLTEKKHEMLSQYYLNDYSLAEIAENDGVSRQAVYDAVRTSNRALDQFEEKLGLYAKFRRIAAHSEQIVKLSKALAEKAEDDEQRFMAERIESMGRRLMEENNE